ncbi:hypothetical protein OL548_23695 [Lysinibacillus sp. MHQ-1]|nr:hypothetical protein OL548_23695 [Lysinibacillus sp. MHQ-1]
MKRYTTKKNVANKIEEVYGKNVSEIEKEWVAFIKRSPEPTKEEKNKNEKLF